MAREDARPTTPAHELTIRKRPTQISLKVFGFAEREHLIHTLKMNPKTSQRFSIGLKSFKRLLLCVCWIGAGACGPAFALSPEGWSRHVQFSSWQTSDGLPNHNVVSVTQTTDGYLWAGTTGQSNNLVRFNGFEFKLPTGLADQGGSGYTCLAAGKKNRLWISTASGAGSLVLWQGGKATRIETTLPYSPSPYRGITLFEDRQERLWIGGAGLLTRTPEGQIQDFSKSMKPFGGIRQITEDGQGTIWMACSNGLVRYHQGVVDQPYPVTNIACSVYASKNGSLWVGSDVFPSLTQITQSGEIIRYGPGEGLQARGIWTMCEDGETNLWIGTYAGLYCARNGQIRHVQESNLKTSFISSLLCDQEGSLWVGTADGLYHLHENPIEHYGASDGLGPISALSSGPSGIWATVFAQGAYLYKDKKWSPIQLNLDQTFSDGQLLETSGGERWLALQPSRSRGYIYRLHPEKAELMLSVQGHSYLYEDNNRLWIVTATNVFAWLDGKLVPMGDGWPALDITYVLTDGKKGLLLGSTQGLYAWEGSLTQRLKFGGNFPGQKISGLVWEGDSLWVVSDQAIARFLAGRWQRLEGGGVAGTGGINAVQLEENDLWLGCENGLFRINRKELEDVYQGRQKQAILNQYGKAHGLSSSFLGSSGLWSQGVVRDHEGRLWFASMNGVEAVEAKRFQNSTPPPVVVEGLFGDQQPVATLPVPSEQIIQVPAGTKNLEIHYAALTYTAPGLVRYRYRLEGLDSGWVNAGNDRVAHYNRLPPGAYQFQVQARNPEGVWNLEGAGFRFVQIPFFYQTRTFDLLCLFLGAVFILVVAVVTAVVLNAISTRRMRLKMAALEAQQAMDQERARIARDIHDDIGSTLTQIVMLSELAGREPDQTFTSDGHLAGIRIAAREITRRLDEIVWAINPRNDTLDALASYISKLATDQTRAAGLHCRLALPPVLPAWPISGAVRHNLFLACKESIHNAIKHAKSTQLQLRLTLDEKSFTIEISDNGVGLPTPLPNQDGDGLHNLQQRMKAAGGSCDFVSIPGQGTTVCLRVARTVQAKSLSTK